MNAATVWLLIKAVAVLLPMIMNMIQTGQIQTATEKEILDAFVRDNEARVRRGISARDGPDSGLPDPDNDRDAA